MALQQSVYPYQSAVSVQQPYNPYSYAPYTVNTQNTQPVQQNQSTVSIVDVNSKEEAFYWPVTAGNSVICRTKDGSAIFTKTAGFSATDPYIFEEFYKKEPVQNAAPETTNSIDYQSEIDKLWGEINALKNRQKPQNNKRREDVDTGNVR